MNNSKKHLLTNNSRISVVVISFVSLLLTACAGQQSAKQLAGLELATMLEYKQAINKTIAAEGKYYQDTSKRLNDNLKEMNVKVNEENSLVRRAIRYVHLWDKNPPSQHDILIMIDTSYLDLGVENKKFEDQRKKLNDQFFSQIEKLSAEQNNLEKSIAALSKLYAREEFNLQTNLIRDYLIGTLGTIRELANNEEGN